MTIYIVHESYNGDDIMPIILDKEAETDTVLVAAKLLAISARTAPKGRGVDRVVTAIVTGTEKERIAMAMEAKVHQKRHPLKGFERDAGNVRKSPAVLLLGVKGTVPKNPKNPLNCGACGYAGCAEFINAEKKDGDDFTGPICIFEALDLGIALGSAVQRARDLNVDNRMMYTIGAAAKALNLLDADVIIGIPLSVTGKNIYFDRT